MNNKVKDHSAIDCADFFNVKSMQAWRRDFHAHPELAYQEIRTSEKVAMLLEEWGYDVQRGIAQTGIVASLKRGSGERAVGLRADMDGLPVMEASSSLAHRSVHAGRMHACGHDGHMAMLLGAAEVLAGPAKFDGTVRLIFQPAEENEAGARRMIDEGLFDRFPVDAVFGVHNMPGIELGHFAIMPGPIMASADFFDIQLEGRGVHAAFPHKGDDVPNAAANIVTAMNQIAARCIDPLSPVVVSVTEIQCGETLNVLPAKGQVRGTVRTFDPMVQDHIELLIRRAVSGVAASYGLKTTVNYSRRYVPTINHPAVSDFCFGVAMRLVGIDRVHRDNRPIMAAEDFGWMLLERPGCYAWIGNGQESADLHSPQYDFNDELLPIGAAYFAGVAQEFLALGSP